ncbi:MAG: MBOAT family O-acyltransferase [Clostridia bacterium]|nr:MBOAT family O-acyltransferase [Clostridia bacterium]
MSLIFYAWGEPKWIILMVGGTLVHYIGGLLIARTKKKSFAKIILAFCIFISLGLLAVFKYYNFFIGEFNSIFNSSISSLRLTLPIGISFYTFQTITYTVDVYRKKAEPQKSFLKLLLYVCMFPQLIAGPIVKYVDVEKALDNREINLAKFSDGLIRFSIGLFKKAVLANFFGKTVSEFLDGDLFASGSAGIWIGLIAYAFQIYFDFSAYSDMAIGLGKILGFDFPENFNYPYEATSINEFWKKWHISLTTFFREYLYIPLGGNRKHHVFNLFIVWLLTGLWHGAATNFILWGLYYFVFISLEKFFFSDIFKKVPGMINHTIGRFYTLFVVLMGWLLFYFEDMSKLKTALWLMFNQKESTVFLDPSGYILGRIFLIILAVFACTRIPANIAKYSKNIFKKNKVLKMTNDVLNFVFVFALLFISTACLVGTTYNPFLYFRF